MVANALKPATPTRSRSRREGIGLEPKWLRTVKILFAYVIGYGRGKSSFLAHVLGYGRGKNSRHPAAAPQKRNCVFSQLRPGAKFGFCTHYRLRTEKKFAFAVFGFRNKIDLTGPARITDHRDAKKNRGEARPSSARIFVPRVRTSTPAREMPVFAHVNEENSSLHTLSVTDGKKFVFCTRSRLRTEKKSRPPAATSKELKLCVFPITDGTKTVFCIRYRLRRKKSPRAHFIFWALDFVGRRSAAVLPNRTEKKLRRKKKTLERDFFFPAVLACTFSSSAVEIRKGRIPISRRNPPEFSPQTVVPPQVFCGSLTSAMTHYCAFE